VKSLRDSTARQAGINAGMSEPWTPSLTIREHGDRCRLHLAADAWGDGATLQEAADDLVARVIQHAMAVRGGCAWARELGAPDRRWLDFLFEVGEIAERGGDVRRHIVRGGLA
jgi:hypothetical protein